MKTILELTQEEAAPLLRGESFLLHLVGGQEISIKIPPQLFPAVIPAQAGIQSNLNRTGGRRGKRGKVKSTRAERKEIFFRVLKETGDVKKAYKAAGVSDRTGYTWRMKSEGRTATASSKRAGRPGKFECPNPDCKRAFRTLEARVRHIRRDHPQDLSEVA